MTVRTILERAAQFTGESGTDARRKLVGPVMPSICVHAWRVFSRVSAQRAFGSAGVQAITDAQLRAHCDAMGDRLSAFDVTLINVADALMLSKSNALPSSGAAS